MYRWKIEVRAEGQRSCVSHLDRNVVRDDLENWSGCDVDRALALSDDEIVSAWLPDDITKRERLVDPAAGAADVKVITELEDTGRLEIIRVLDDGPRTLEAYIYANDRRREVRRRASVARSIVTESDVSAEGNGRARGGSDELANEGGTGGRRGVGRIPLDSWCAEGKSSEGREGDGGEGELHGLVKCGWRRRV